MDVYGTAPGEDQNSENVLHHVDATASIGIIPACPCHCGTLRLPDSENLGTVKHLL
jgi:hypothetical protein